MKPTQQYKEAALSNASLIRTTLFSIFVLTGLSAGYTVREEFYWTPENGLGYWFGIVGAACMLLLLVYPLRKRYAVFSNSMTVAQWFKLHMALGIIGPVFILLHCNFNLGSFNSNIALLAMLLMVASGLVGRFIYSKIHRGLYGNKHSLVKLKEDKQQLLERISTQLPDANIANDIVQILCKFEAQVLKPRSVSGNIFNVVTLSFQTRSQHHALKKKITILKNHLLISDSTALNTLTVEESEALTTLKKMIRHYLGLVRKTAELGFYERVFSLWHVLHLPIFGLLILAASLHVYAVHNY